MSFTEWIYKRYEEITLYLIFLILLILYIISYFFAELFPVENLTKITLIVLILTTIISIQRSIFHSSRLASSLEQALNPLRTEFNTLRDVIKKTSEQCVILSNSTIDNIIATYSRDELIDFIMKCSTEHLNKFEGLYKDSRISKLYQKHGLLELTNEPRKSKLKLEYVNEREIESNKILLNIIQSYTATNEASEESSKNKRLNEDGLVTYVSLDLKNLDEIKNTLQYLTAILRYIPSFPRENPKSKELTLSPLVLANDDYENIDRGKHIKKTIKKELLSGVYRVSKKQDGYYLLELSLILDIEIPPKGVMDIHVETEVPVPNFYLWTYEFTSWTDSIDLELRKFNNFETEISYVLPGVLLEDRPSNITKTKLEYKRWIIPHSSISVAWAKKNM